VGQVFVKIKKIKLPQKPPQYPLLNLFSFFLEMDRQIFREYDIRGIAGREIDGNTANLIGRAFATMVRDSGGKKVVVGRDNRESGPALLKELLAGISDGGVDAVYIGEIPTPLLYYAVNKLDCDGGISVTASHNPPQFNGFKVMVGKDAIYGKRIQEIADIIESGKLLNKICNR